MGNVFGFRSMPPRATIYAHPFSGAVIATPVLDLLMRQDNGVVTDRTGYGNNGVVTGCLGARGVFDEGQKFAGVPANYLTCGFNPSLDIAQNISVGAWAKCVSAGLTSIMAKADGGVNGWGLFLDAAGRIFAYFYADASTVTGVNNLRGRWAHAWMTVQDNVCRVFADGLQEARGAVTMSDFAAGNLIVAWNAFPFYGMQELDQIFSGALSPEQVYRKYLEARDVPIYLDDFSSYAVTPVAKTAGSMCGPARVINNPMLITVDANGKKWLASAGLTNCYAVTQMQDNSAYGTLTHKFKRAAGQDHYFHWCGSGFPTAQNGYAIIITDGGTARVYRYTAGAVAATVFNNACVTVAGTEYECRLVRRVGGQICLYLKGGAFVDWVLVGGPATDNTHTTAGFLAPWLLIDDATTDWALNRVCERPASFPWEFLSGTYSGVVSGTTVWMNCLTAGVTYLPKDLDWQTMIFGARRGAAPNTLDTLFVASEIGGTTAANQNGYCLRMAAGGAIQLIRTTGGVEAAPIATTAASFTGPTNDYEFKINRVWSTNAYEFYIRGGAYADWTPMFAATLGIYTSSNYTCWDMDAAGRITAPTYYRDVR